MFNLSNYNALYIYLCLQSVKVVILPMSTVLRTVAKCLFRLKFILVLQSSRRNSEGDLPGETRTKV